MKKLYFLSLLGLFVMSASMYAQAQSLTYHGIAMNTAGQQLANQTISLRLSVLLGNATGTAVYVETQSATSNGAGAYTVQIGQGNVVSGTFASINWMSVIHFLKVEMDPTGGSNYVVVSNGQVLANATAAATGWQCGSALTVNHATGLVAPVSKTVSYGTVTNIPGATSKCWITSNLGADHQATAKDDATEASAGWYWQFNKKQGYKQDGSTVTPAWTITSISENSDWLLVNDPCALELGFGWRIPTSTEWTNIQTAGSWTNWTMAWNSALKLHAAGFVLNDDGSIDSRGTLGDFWSSMQNDASIAWYANAYSTSSSLGAGFKSSGISVRCIKD